MSNSWLQRARDISLKLWKPHFGKRLDWKLIHDLTVSAYLQGVQDQFVAMETESKEDEIADRIDRLWADEDQRLPKRP